MSNFRVAVVQGSSEGLDCRANLEKGLAYCEEAAKNKPDLILFPELWSIGYQIAGFGSGDEMKRYALSPGSTFLRKYQAFAASAKVAIAITFVEAIREKMFDSVLLIDSAGRGVLRYAKMHTCDFSNEKYFTPGEAPEAVGLSVRGEIVRVGCMICYDREFPETSRILMLRGAEIALIPNACPIERHRKGQLAARAFENMMGVVMANYARPEQNGNSAAYSGICFDDELNELDDTLMEAGEEEAILVADFNMQMIRRYREKAFWGDAYRKPDQYGMLLFHKTLEEFKRQDSRRIAPA
jgi:predicted amidohydrolase